MAKTAGKSKGKKESPKSIYDRRVDAVIEMILCGLRRRQILQKIAKDENLQWDVTASQIDNYIAKAKEQIRVSIEPDKIKLSDEIQAKYNFLYEKLATMGDYKNAVIPLDKLSELAGLKILKIAGDDANPLRVEIAIDAGINKIYGDDGAKDK